MHSTTDVLFFFTMTKMVSQKCVYNPIFCLIQEMMYVWNGFTIVGKRPELTENILTTIQKAEEKLNSEPSELMMESLH